MSAIQQRRAMESVADLTRALEEYGTEMATKIGVTANRQAAQKGKDELVQAAPYDPNRKPGRKFRHLKQEIRVRRQKAKKQHHIVHNISTGRAFWGGLVERGTAKMRARPWWRPTISRIGDALLEAQVGGLRAGHAKAARKAARLSRRS